jgi:hypothetical protein
VGVSDRDQGPTEVRFQASYRLDGTDLTANETVVIHTLDTVLKTNGIGRIDFVKMDVDGFEGKVIRGAQETLAKHRPVLFFELTPAAVRANGDNPDEVLRTLLGLGYTMRTDAGAPIDDIDAYLAKIAQGYGINMLAVPPGR